jgi:hypothetical protein
MLVNLTPHPLRFYPAGTPDHIDEGSAVPCLVLDPSPHHKPARLGQRAVGPTAQAPDFPLPHDGTWYVVSLAVGLAADHRADLLVLHEHVRDLNGRIIGARKLGHPCRPV